MLRRIEGTSARSLEYPKRGQARLSEFRDEPAQRKRSGRRAASRPSAVGMVLWAAVVLMGMGVVERNAESARVGYELAALEAQSASVEQENHELNIRVANLQAPERIYQLAISRLGMVRPKGFEIALAPAAAPAAGAQDSAVRASSPENRFVRFGRQILGALVGPSRAEAKGAR